MNAYDVNTRIHVLTPLLEAALLDTMTETAKVCRLKAYEPDYVAMLSTRFVRQLYYILGTVFPDYDFSVTGVYCHQKPIVDINSDRKPELGDVLFVYADRSRSKKLTVNSLLLQAKLSTYPQLTIHKAEMHQLELYKQWPEFTYYRAGYLNGKRRNILPKTINDGAQYLLMDTNPMTNGEYGFRGTFPMGCAVPDEILYVNDSLANELTNLLKFKSGRTVDSDPYRTKDGWSKMIWDLLSLSAATISKRKNARIDSFYRRNTYVHYSSENMSEKSLLDEAQGFFSEIGRIQDEDVGVSLVLIESQIREEQEKRDKGD